MPVAQCQSANEERETIIQRQPILGKAPTCDSARVDEHWWPLEHIRYDRIWA
jgi:hypothetical protein